MTDDPRSGRDGDDPGQRLEDLLAEHRDDPEIPDDAAEPDPFDPFAPVDPGPADGETDGMGGDPAADEPDEPEDELPDAPLFALLRTVEHEIGIDRIDRVWVFPARRLDVGETSLVVVAAFPEIEGDRRRVYAAHYTAHDEATEPRLVLAEYGTAPTERVGRLVEDVVDRVKDGPAGAPRAHTIGGADDRWHTFLHELAEAHLEEAQKDRRIR